jgi:hypothetical protein
MYAAKLNRLSFVFTVSYCFQEFIELSQSSQIKSIKRYAIKRHYSVNNLIRVLENNSLNPYITLKAGITHRFEDYSTYTYI